MEKCNCEACKLKRRIEAEREAGIQLAKFTEEVKAQEVTRNNEQKSIFDLIFGNQGGFMKKEVEVKPEVEEKVEEDVADENEVEVKAKPVIKNFVYAPTRQYFIETNMTTGETKEDYFRLPERKEKVIHSDNTTIVILHDGTKGVAKCHPLDEQSRLKGIKIAYTRAKIKLLQKELKKLIK